MTSPKVSHLKRSELRERGKGIYLFTSNFLPSMFPWISFLFDYNDLIWNQSPQRGETMQTPVHVNHTWPTVNPFLGISNTWRSNVCKGTKLLLRTQDTVSPDGRDLMEWNNGVCVWRILCTYSWRRIVPYYVPCLILCLSYTQYRVAPIWQSILGLLILGLVGFRRGTKRWKYSVVDFVLYTGAILATPVIHYLFEK